MSATPYRAISWSVNEPAWKDKLNQMTNNDQWLYENAPRMYYNSHGIKRHNGLKMAAGHIILGNTRTRYSATACYFGTYFSEGCKPVVVVGMPLTYPRRDVTASIRGIGGGWPDHRGFEIYMFANTTAPFVGYLYFPWHAIGY